MMERGYGHVTGGEGTQEVEGCMEGLQRAACWVVHHH